MIFTQTVWVVIILMATWFCYEGARFDRTPFRILAFLAIVVGVANGLHELGQLARVLQGYPIRRVYPVELFLLFGLVATKYFDLKRFIRVTPHG